MEGFPNFVRLVLIRPRTSSEGICLKESHLSIIYI